KPTPWISSRTSKSCPDRWPNEPARRLSHGRGLSILALKIAVRRVPHAGRSFAYNEEETMGGIATDSIRAAALVGHAGSGKTLLTEMLLHRAGAIAVA